MANNIISLSSRNFTQYKEQLLKYVNDYYPELSANFIDNSVGQLLLDLNCGVADSLNFYIDKQVNENFISFAQERDSLLELAKNNGVKIPNTTPSVTVCDFTVSIPVKGDRFDDSYLPVIRTGTQVVGNGVIFEVDSDIDFRSERSASGITNRTYVPIFDGNNRIIRYDFTKREVLVSGRSKQFRTIVNNSRDFFTIVLPDINVISVEQVIIKSGTNNAVTLNTSDFFNDAERWYEVDYLAQRRIFKNQGFKGQGGFFIGKWVDIDQKFITEFTKNGYCKLTFGNGQNVNNEIANVLATTKETYNLFLGTYKNNSLGVRVPSNSTIYIRYKVGGGANSNVPPNSINKLGFLEVDVNGARNDINEQIKRTIKVNNPIPALGGKDVISNEEIRYLSIYNKSAYNRAVTLNDYTAIISAMRSEFGKPYKFKPYKLDNKVIIGVLGLNQEGKLTNQSTDTMKNNILNYLTEYRNINDYVEIIDNKIINLGVNVDIVIDENVQRNSIISNVRSAVRDFFDINKINIGDTLFVGELYRDIANINGVLNIVSFDFYNIIDSKGVKYSPDITTMDFVDNSQPTTDIYKKEIQVVNNSLFSDINEMFEIRYPTTDIVITLNTLNIT